MSYWGDKVRSLPNRRTSALQEYDVFMDDATVFYVGNLTGHALALRAMGVPLLARTYEYSNDTTADDDDDGGDDGGATNDTATNVTRRALSDAESSWTWRKGRGFNGVAANSSTAATSTTSGAANSSTAAATSTTSGAANSSTTATTSTTSGAANSSTAAATSTTSGAANSSTTATTSTTSGAANSTTTTTTSATTDISSGTARAHAARTAAAAAASGATQWYSLSALMPSGKVMQLLSDRIDAAARSAVRFEPFKEDECAPSHFVAFDAPSHVRDLYEVPTSAIASSN